MAPAGDRAQGEPAIWGAFLRPSSVYTSYVAGILSMDQRLVKFQLRPGAEDPGPGNWGAQPWIPPGSRTGLLATFNGGFKLDAAGGGFYLNGKTQGGPGQRGRVDRLLPRRHDQDRPVGQRPCS